MKLEQLKQIIENIYGFDLSDRSRKMGLVDARRIYCRIAYSIGYNLREIGEPIDRKHCNVIHLINTADLAQDFHKRVHDQLVEQYGFLSKLFYIEKVQKIESQAARECNNESINLIKEINKTLTKWDTESLNNFLNTRVKVYDKLIGVTKPQKQIKQIQGAKLNRPIKNPLLC
tara:strand:+ start:2579 stop:3097 length:519 start_codon:yes stop_codon:yes gene_type:complete